MMKYIFKPLLLIVALSITSCSNKNKANSNNDREQIDDYSAKIDSLIEATSPRLFNGVILITKEGETKYLREYGYSNFEDEIPISIKDKFRIMSNSKQITAVLILKEVEKGKIGLQNPISNYLPGLKQAWANKVTIHQLLNTLIPI